MMMNISEGVRSLRSKILGALVVGIILFFLARQLIRSWDEIPFNQFRLEIGWLTLSYLGLLVSFLLTVRAWQEIMSSLKQSMNYYSSWWVITGSYLGKYIPGHVWAIGGRMWLCKRQGISEKHSGTGMLLEMLLLLLGSLLIFSSGLLLPSFPSPFNTESGVLSWVYLLLIPEPFLLAVLFTSLLSWALRTMAKLVFKREISLEIDRKILARALILIITSSFIQGLAFYMLARSIYPVDMKVMLHFIALYNGAWAAGFLSIVAPGGLGVREGALILLLKPYLPTSVAIIIAALARLWITLFEIAMALIGLFMRMKK